MGGLRREPSVSPRGGGLSRPSRSAQGLIAAAVFAGGGAVGGTGGSALAFGEGGPEWEPSASFSREGRCGAGTGCNVVLDCGNRVASGGVGASSGVGVTSGGAVAGSGWKGGRLLGSLVSRP